MKRVVSAKLNLKEDLSNLPAYQELFWSLTWRNIRLQYQNWIMGIFGSVISPLLMTLIFFIVLNNRVGVDFSHYFLYIYSGFLFWNVFGAGLSRAYISFLVENTLVKKIYFPRFLLPLSYLMAKLTDFLIAFVVFIILILFSDIELSWGRLIVFSALAIVSLSLVSSGIYLAFAVISVRFRGFQMIFPFVSQAIFFTAPVVYNARLSIENDVINSFFWFNPINGALHLFRSGVFSEFITPLDIVLYLLFAFAVFIAGFIYFKIEDKNLVDRL